ASVHERRHPKPFEMFLSARPEKLAHLPTLLLSVSLSAAFEEGLEEAQEYVEEMEMRTGVQHDKTLLIAGAIRTSRYDYYALQVVRHIIMRGKDYDPSVSEHEFTDWEALGAELEGFVAG
ncbi:MAG: flavodoxin domain-containing protein, partial [Paracoccaceae bacterium]